MSMQQRIEDTARAAFAPVYSECLNESHMHSRGTDSHFKLTLVSEQFEGVRKVARHQKVYAALGGIMQEIHALALHTYTPAEWDEQVGAPASPRCLGGSRFDKATG